jgi:transcriptional regulator with XRE-family HTH domain
MTPFGQKLRQLRKRNDITQKQLAAKLDISAAYLSALEHGRRGRPSPMLVDQICALFDIIWDEADELRDLGRLSHPKITIDTAGLDASATELANRLARDIGRLSPAQIAEILEILRR